MSLIGMSTNPQAETKPPVEGQDVAKGDAGVGMETSAGEAEPKTSASRSQTAKAVVTSAAKSMVYMHRQDTLLALSSSIDLTDISLNA